MKTKYYVAYKKTEMRYVDCNSKTIVKVKRILFTVSIYTSKLCILFDPRAQASNVDLKRIIYASKIFAFQ